MTVTPGGVLTRRAPSAPFEVHLDVFSGPFELLLGLISKHRLDITEVALARVTDEFLAHTRAASAGEGGWDLSQATEFLVVAATLLDLKASRLLPTSGEGDQEDLELIEARDLLFARLLQYRAFKEVALWLGGRAATAGRAVPRSAGLEERFSRLLPELVMTVTPEQLAQAAARALTPRRPPTVGVEHLHAAGVSVREQAQLMAERLMRAGESSFAELLDGAQGTAVVVARFLGLLELYREGRVALVQEAPFSDLRVRWVGAADPGDLPDVAAGSDDDWA